MKSRGDIGSAQRTRGVSMLEMLIVVSIVGILGYLAAGHYGAVVVKSRETVARNLLDLLNNGVSLYLQAEGDALRRVTPDNAASQDEVDVLRALQWVDPVQPTPGSPYVTQQYNPGVSASLEDYRLVWNGAFFELRIPGQDGAGLAVAFDGADAGRTVIFPDGYVLLEGY